MPLDQHIEGRHGACEPGVDIRPHAVPDPLEMADEGQQGEHRWLVEAAIAGKTDHRAVTGGAFRAEGRRKGLAKRAGRAQIGLPGAIHLDHRAGPDAGIAGIGHEDPIHG